MQMTRSGGFEPLESLDGRFVYYVRLNREGIWRVPTEGGEETRVLDRGTAGRWALFAQGIYLLTTDAVRGAAVEFFDFKTGWLSQIAALPRETIGPSYDRVFAVSPDGRWILYVQIDRSDSDIMLVEHFR